MTSRRRKAQKLLRRAWKFLAAFSLQAYLSLAFLWMAVVLWIEPAGVALTPLWPPIFLAVSLSCLASVLRPFSPTMAAATGAFIATVAAARIGAILGTFTGHFSSVQLLGVALWGLFVVVGLRWPRIAYDSGVKHLLDVAREREGDEPDVRNRG